MFLARIAAAHIGLIIIVVLAQLSSTATATYTGQCNSPRFLRVPFTFTHLSVRGGGDGEKHPGMQDEVSAAGVLDLRAAVDPASIAIARSDFIFLSVNSTGTFPISDTYGEKDDEKENQKAIDMQSAAALTVGTVCNSIYLVITYDPALGKTILQRTAGVKLAAVVNGLRQRLIEGKNAVNNSKLTLLLVPSSCHEQGENSWDTSGAEFLVDRLRTFFSMGMECTKEGKEGDGGICNIEPFHSVDIVPLLTSAGIKMTTKIHTIVASDSSIECGNHTNEGVLVSHLQSTYESLGGTGQMKFQKPTWQY